VCSSDDVAAVVRVCVSTAAAAAAVSAGVTTAIAATAAAAAAAVTCARDVHQSAEVVQLAGQWWLGFVPHYLCVGVQFRNVCPALTVK
jgi:hypothetical protein